MRQRLGPKGRRGGSHDLAQFGFNLVNQRRVDLALLRRAVGNLALLSAWMRPSQGKPCLNPVQRRPKRHPRPKRQRQASS